MFDSVSRVARDRWSSLLTVITLVRHIHVSTLNNLLVLLLSVSLLLTTHIIVIRVSLGLCYLTNLPHYHGVVYGIFMNLIDSSRYILTYGYVGKG